MHAIIDGGRYECEAGASILTALHRAGIEIPTLCHDDRLKSVGECRLCLVRLADRGRLVPACTTPIEDAMVIETHSPELETYRTSLLQMLACRYPAAAVEQFPDEPFHKLLRAYGIAAQMSAVARERGCDHSHPYIAVDMSRCIDCYRCVRICTELQGQRVWRIRGRGIETSIEPDGPTLRESSCVSCGACVDTCPTGALRDAEAPSLSAPLTWTRTTCPYCGVGCEMNVGTREGRIVAVRPLLDAPVSKGHLC
jgi:formate dehydrogenase major subunit